MASLIIARDTGYADRIRKYKVVVDGIVVGRIANGETQEFPVTPGRHQLRMKIDWCGSKPLEFSVSEKDVLAFEAKTNLRGYNLLLALGSWCLPGTLIS